MHSPENARKPFGTDVGTGEHWPTFDLLLRLRHWGHQARFCCLLFFFLPVLDGFTRYIYPSFPEKLHWPLRCRHNEHDGVSNLQPHDCSLNHLFRCRSKKTSKLRVTCLCEGNSPVTGDSPVQRARNAEKMLPFDDIIMTLGQPYDRKRKQPSLDGYRETWLGHIGEKVQQIKKRVFNSWYVRPMMNSTQFQELFTIFVFI